MDKKQIDFIQKKFNLLNLDGDYKASFLKQDYNEIANFLNYQNEWIKYCLEHSDSIENEEEINELFMISNTLVHEWTEFKTHFRAKIAQKDKDFFEVLHFNIVDPSDMENVIETITSDDILGKDVSNFVQKENTLINKLISLYNDEKTYLKL